MQFRHFVIPAIGTLCGYLSDRHQKTVKPFYLYFMYFLLFLAINWTFLSANEDMLNYEKSYETGVTECGLICVETPEMLNLLFEAYHGQDLTDRQVIEIRRLVKHHKEEGKKEFNEAHKISPLYPENLQKKVAEAFALAISYSIQNKSYVIVVVGLIGMLVDYGCNMCDAWAKMSEHLEKSKQQFELMEWYKKILTDHGYEAHCQGSIALENDWFGG